MGRKPAVATTQRSVDHAPTWAAVVRAADGLCCSEQQLLEVVARLPLVPIRQLLPFSVTSERSTYASVARLVERGLVSSFTGPAEGAGRRPKLLLLTNVGLAVLACWMELDPVGLARGWNLERTGLRPLIGELPGLLRSYALLALLAETGPCRARLCAWARPWRWRAPFLPGGGIRGLQLPAFAELAWRNRSSERPPHRYVLIADGGGLSPLALRPQLARLARLQQTTELAVPTLAIATTSERRVEAWQSVLARVGSSRQARPLRAEVATWDNWRTRTRRGRVPRAQAAGMPPRAADRLSLDGGREAWQQIPRPIDLRDATIWVRRWDLAPGERTMLDLIGRHPFLAASTIADVLGVDVRWVQVRAAALVRKGLARVVPPNELPQTMGGKWDLLELTVEGLRLMAGYLGLPLASAVRHHGLAGGGTADPIGPRRALLAHLAHTRGTDAVFAAIARAARRQRGGALVEWRNAAGCAHGRVRPDGYGLLRLGRREYGFFLEFDRGTVRPRALRAKFAAYQRYRASARAAREYRGFPTILVVTTRPGAEERLADAARAVHVGWPTLPVLFTTLDWIEGHRDGVLGAIWRDAETVRRRSWPLSFAPAAVSQSFRSRRRWKTT